MEHAATIKMFFLAGKTPSDAYASLSAAMGDNCISLSMVYRYLRQFQDGRTSTEDGRGKSSHFTVRTPENINLVRLLVEQDGRRTIQDFDKEIQLSPMAPDSKA